MTVGYHTWPYAFNEILCGVSTLHAIENAIVEAWVFDTENLIIPLAVWDANPTYREVRE